MCHADLRKVYITISLHFVVIYSYNTYDYAIQINKSDILKYDGVGKPPYCEVTFKAVSNVSNPPDLTATVLSALVHGAD